MTKAFFQLSYICAWVLLFFSALAAIGFPFIDFVPPNRPAEFELHVASALSAVVAFGAYHLTRRRLWGLPFVLLLPAAFGFYSNFLLTAAYLVVACAVFGVPFVSLFLEARARAASKAS